MRRSGVRSSSAPPFTWLLALATLVVSLQPLPGLAQLFFLDVSQAAGVTNSHGSSTFGVGQAWIDVERDGDLDLFVSNRHGPNHLYINQGDETFTEPAEFAILAMPGDLCHGVAVGDYDNDGWQDIYVTCAGPPLPAGDLADLLQTVLTGQGHPRAHHCATAYCRGNDR